MVLSSAVRDIESTTLSNGIRVITEAMPGVRSVSIGLWIGTGSRSERPAECGISHFIEHMLFKGTTTRSAEDIARQMDSVGGHLDAFTGKELVGFNVKVIDEHVDFAFGILADMLLDPRFSEQDIEKERGVILEELKMDKDSPETQIHELFMSRFWPRHPLGRPILGSRKTISSFSAASLRAWHRRYYSPVNLTITAAGNLRHEDFLGLVDRHFGALEPAGELPPVEPPRNHPVLQKKNRRSLQQVHFCIAAPAIEASHAARFACYVMNVILGGSMSSRLFQNIREKQGLVYSIYSELNLYRDAGCLGVYGGASTENIRKVVDGTLAEFRRLKEEPVEAEELRRAKDHMKGSLMLSLESTTARMGNLARQQLYFARTFSLDEMVDAIESVTRAEVQSLACRFFDPAWLGVALLGRLDGLRIERADLVC